MLAPGEYDEMPTDLGYGRFAELKADGEVELIALPHELIHTCVGEIGISPKKKVNGS
ncbi:hypothetical protein GCM10023191_077600 [Actinoallomurus oryzae]|uniref:Uncharacterized protein n=1 Tax=Actinoallomurus oryzae TaxID=502180 RepID=A0ABP8QWX3_9ACTN